MHNKRLLEMNLGLSRTHEKENELNEELESKVEERTRELKKQIQRITRYTWMNSHEVCAPLTGILGLTEILNKSEMQNDLYIKAVEGIQASATELDQVFRKNNLELAPLIKEANIDSILDHQKTKSTV